MAKKILFINQEISPFIEDSVIAELGNMLPQKMQEGGYEIRTFMPKWGKINERRGQLHEVIRLSGMNIIIDDTDHTLIIKVASIPSTRIQVYFIDNDDYFQKVRDGEELAEEVDDGERAMFFARGVLETVKKLKWVPDVIICQGWITSLVPLYVKTVYKDEPSFMNAKVITNLFDSCNLKENIGDRFKDYIKIKGVKSGDLKSYKKQFDFNELCKLAADFSDAVVDLSQDVTPDVFEKVVEKNIPLEKYKADKNVIDKLGVFYNKILDEITEE